MSRALALGGAHKDGERLLELIVGVLLLLVVVHLVRDQRHKLDKVDVTTAVGVGELDHLFELGR